MQVKLLADNSSKNLKLDEDQKDKKQPLTADQKR